MNDKHDELLVEYIKRRGAGSADGNKFGECFVFHSMTTVGVIIPADRESKNHCAASGLILSLRDGMC